MMVMVLYVVLDAYGLVYIGSIKTMGEHLVRMPSRLKTRSCMTIDSVRDYRDSGRS